MVCLIWRERTLAMVNIRIRESKGSAGVPASAGVQSYHQAVTATGGSTTEMTWTGLVETPGIRRAASRNGYGIPVRDAAPRGPCSSHRTPEWPPKPSCSLAACGNLEYLRFPASPFLHLSACARFVPQRHPGQPFHWKDAVLRVRAEIVSVIRQGA